MKRNQSTPTVTCQGRPALTRGGKRGKAAEAGVFRLPGRKESRYQNEPEIVTGSTDAQHPIRLLSILARRFLAAAPNRRQSGDSRSGPFVSLSSAFAVLLLVGPAFAAGPADDTVVLNEAGARNLGIEFAMVEEADFEETVFALGRIEHIPARHAMVSSRISGRVSGVNAYIGDLVEKGASLLTLESRQSGNPPPSIKLAAPIGGLVMKSEAHLGQPVEPSEVLMEILDIRKLWAVARVPEHSASQLEPGETRARICLPALQGETITGTLLRFGTAADRESGTIGAVFEIENPTGKMRPGMRAKFSIVTGTRENVMAIPRAALQGDPANRVVYVKHFELPNAFIKSPVETGAQNSDMVEIVSGLFPGDEVVTTGAYFLGFAGGGGISLKEALDAAHGHEHNEDGSEMTPEQRAAKAAEKAAAAGASSGAGGPWTLFFALLSGVLFLLLLLSVALRFRRPDSDA